MIEYHILGYARASRYPLLGRTFAQGRIQHDDDLTSGHRLALEHICTPEHATQPLDARQPLPVEGR